MIAEREGTSAEYSGNRQITGFAKKFDSNFHWDNGWRSPKVKADWAHEAEVLIPELQEALAGKADLSVELWPLEYD